ncbi:MAG: hypothetical protein JKX76_01160 [Colwellia sp.]|nr:hypothetical protein [Colwellia sp.]
MTETFLYTGFANIMNPSDHSITDPTHIFVSMMCYPEQRANLMINPETSILNTMIASNYIENVQYNCIVFTVDFNEDEKIIKAFCTTQSSREGPSISRKKGERYNKRYLANIFETSFNKVHGTSHLDSQNTRLCMDYNYSDITMIDSTDITKGFNMPFSVSSAICPNTFELTFNQETVIDKVVYCTN